MWLPRDFAAAIVVDGRTAAAVGRFAAAAAGVVEAIAASVGVSGAVAVGTAAVVGDSRTQDSTGKRLKPNSPVQMPKWSLLVDRHNTPV